MELAFLYQYLYHIIVAIITLVYVRWYKHAQAMKPSNNSGVVFLVLFMTLAIGLRPISGHFVDMANYRTTYEARQGDVFYFSLDTDNVIFDNFFMWWTSNSYSLQLFFLLVAAIYFGCAYIGIKRLFPNHSMIAYIVFLGALSTFSYSTNGIKAGAAASIFIMALGYWDKLYVCIPLMLVSLGFHHSMIMPLAAFAVTLFFKNPKWYYYGWFACFLMACFHVTYFQFLFGGMADEQGAAYLTTTQSSEINIGFRPDFILYSAMPVVIGYLMEIKRKVPVSKTYSTIMHFYLMTNAVWMLCMYAEFTNRIAYLSWFVYPVVIIYPFLDAYNTDVNKYKKLYKTVLYHLSFTLFMVFIYYGLLASGR